MPHEDSVQVVKFARNITSPIFGSAVIEIGAKGNAASLLGIHTSVSGLFVTDSLQLFFALSSNPAHELTPPATAAAFFNDPALYGSNAITSVLTAAGTTGRARALLVTLITPLYGLIRPRRQIIVFMFIHATNTLAIRAEIFYRPIQLNRTDLDTLDLKYGKYRRGA